MAWADYREFPPILTETRLEDRRPVSPEAWNWRPGARGPKAGARRPEAGKPDAQRPTCEKPETYLGAQPPDGSPEPSPEIYLVRHRSPNERELPGLDENLRRHTVRLMLPGTRRKAWPPDGAELMNCTTNQNRCRQIP